MTEGSERKPSYSVRQYCTSVQKLLQSRVPRVWVRGTISQLNIRGRAVYLSLSEFAEGETRPVSSLSCLLWITELERINARLSTLPRPFRLEADLKVCLLLEADFYVPQGRFQAHVLDIDPAYTIGEQVLARREILNRLSRDGLIQKNSSLAFPRLPLRVGLVTAQDSAAHNDFHKVLLSSPWAFEVVAAWARMQGEQTESTVVQALQKLAIEELDLVCIVRGGGSKSDLSYFDSEVICRTIATMPVPVLTGIGHQIDSSLADVVAWADRITPTDCAEFLVERLNTAYAELFELKNRLLRSARLPVQSKKERLAFYRTRLRRGVPKVLNLARAGFREESTRLRLLWESARRSGLQGLAALRTRLAGGCAALHHSEKRRHVVQTAGLSAGSGKLLALAVNTAELKGQLLRSLDPRRVLERGYAIVHVEKDGKERIAKFGDLCAGQPLCVELRDGLVHSRVEQLTKKKVKE